MGYRVTQVGEEHVPPVVRKAPPWARSLQQPPQRGAPLIALWGPIAAVAVLLVIFVFASISASVRTQEAFVAGGGQFAHHPAMPEVQIPEVPQVVLPQVAAAPRGPEELAAPVAWNAPVAKDAVCPDNACKPADRETFGTKVAFVRNPIEATRLAGEERKLAFVLHVSGNFEEARFT
jgi:hypothetical protein